MPNNLTANAMDGALAGAGPLQSQGPQVDAGAMQTPAASDQQQPVSIDQVKEVVHKQAAVDQKLRKLMDEGGPIPRKKVIQVATELVAERVMSAQAMAGYLAELPEDPQAIREWVEGHAKEAETQLEQLLMLMHGLDAQGPTTPDSQGPTTPDAQPQVQ